LTGNLTANQKARLLAAQAQNVENSQSADHMSSNAEGTVGEDIGPSWLSILGNYGDYLTKNVNVQLNFGTLDGVGGGKKRRILDAQGFPANIEVKYTYAAPGSYVPWASDEDREIKQIVLHSFGQSWHAYKTNGEWFGVMNDADKVSAYYFVKDGVNKTVWVPKGSDPNRGYAQWDRLTSSIRALVQAPPGVSGVHFVIDRAGNLYVMGDCNDVMGSSGVLSDTCISIALEEALYAPTISEGNSKRELPATWLPSGTPLGTEGTLQHWDYSAFQYVTLATLIRKLQNGIPTLKTVTHSSTPRSVDSSFIGYTMHSHITDAPQNIVDVSPHFQEDQDWIELFELVEVQASVDQYATWQKVNEGPSGLLSWVEPIITAMGPETVGILRDASINPAIHTLMGVYRAHLEVSRSPGAYREAAASLMANESKLQKQKEGVGKMIENAKLADLSLPAESTPDPEDPEGRDSAIDTEGLYRAL
jgi:hypothetical protein